MSEERQTVYRMRRNVQLVPANAFGSMVHCLAVAGSDLWCCTGGGTIAVFDLVTLQIKAKVRSACAGHSSMLQLKHAIPRFVTILQGFAAHNGEILSAAVVPSSDTIGSIVLTGGHDWQVCDSIVKSSLSGGVLTATYNTLPLTITE